MFNKSQRVNMYTFFYTNRMVGEWKIYMIRAAEEISELRE